MDDGLAVYIHWPYCARICPYCDFNIYKQRDEMGLVEAILSDLKGWRDWSGSRDVTSIHFGGGTPSLMMGEDIAAIIKAVGGLWTLAGDCEFAIEANPIDANTAKWKTYRAAGVTRLSLGAQTFHNPALNFLGRDHNAEGAKAALKMAVDIFPSVSLDLIFGWAGQTKALLDQDLDIAFENGAQHISTYQLTIEEGTAFAKAEARGDIKAVDSDKSADLYELVRDRLIGEGLEHYEVSNFAKPGHRSKHNLAYWQGRDYVGVGPGAHGRLTVDGARYATIAAMRPEDYKTRIAEAGTGIAEKDALSAQAHAEEYLLMGLRIEEGISLSRYAKIAGSEIPADIIQELSNAGFITYEGDRLKASAEGRLVLNILTEKLLLN